MMLFNRVKSALGLAATLVLVSSGVQAESLSQALARAYANNPQLASALLSVKVSAEAIAAAQSGLRPNIGASVGANGRWSVVGGVGSEAYSSSLSLTYNQKLFDNYATDANIAAAQAGTDAQKQQMRVTEQDVLLNTANAYVNVVRDTQLVQLRAENVKFLKAQAGSAKDRLQVGEGTRTDVSQADAQLAQAVASYQAAINTLRSTQGNYERWVGLKPQNLSLSFDFNSALPNSLDEALNRADSQHPAILASAAAIRAAKAGVDAADSAFGPSLGLSSSLGATNDYTKNNTTVSASVGLTLSIPIYDGGRLGSATRKANLQQIKSEVDAMNVRDQVRAAVIAAWSGLQSAQSQIDAVQAAENATQLALNGVIEELNVGQRTTLDVLNAQSSLTDIKITKISAQTSKVSAAFSLLAATGRLSAADLGLPVQIVSADGYVGSVKDVWQELRTISE